MQSERIDIHSMSAQQKADYTYGKVHSLYENKVAEAEQLRQQTADGPLNALLNKLASNRTQQKLEEGLQKRRNLGVDVSQATRTVDLGMAGLFRIGHVHENSMVTRDNSRKTEHIEKALSWYGRHDSPISIRRTTNIIDETIHNNPIYWRGEATQDLLRTLHHQGEEDSRAKAVEENIELELMALKWEDDWKKDPQKSKKVAARSSALGMIKVQRARHTRDLQILDLGFNQVQEAHEIARDPHRMAAASMWLAAYAFHPKFNTESNSQRFILALKGFTQFSQILISPDYKQAISALGQASPVQNIIKKFLAPFKSGS